MKKKSEDILNYSKYSDKTFNLNYYFYLIFVLMNKFKDKFIKNLKRTIAEYYTEWEGMGGPF